jgi:hypothetical protein
MSRAPPSVQCRELHDERRRAARPLPIMWRSAGDACVTATGNERGEPHAPRWHASRKQLLELRGTLSKEA